MTPTREELLEDDLEQTEMDPDEPVVEDEAEDDDGDDDGDKDDEEG